MQNLASGDFTNIVNAVDGIYTLNGAPVPITDVFNTSHPDNTFDPINDIDAGGIKGGTGFFLVDSIVAQLVDGFTVVLECYFDRTAANARISLNMADPDYNIIAGLQLAGSTSLDRITIATIPSLGDPAIQHNNLFQTTGIHKIAFTFAANKTVFSLDGGAILSLAQSTLEAATDRIYFGALNMGTTRLRSITLYTEQDDSDLPSLSDL